MLKGLSPRTRQPGTPVTPLLNDWYIISEYLDILHVAIHQFGWEMILNTNSNLLQAQMNSAFRLFHTTILRTILTHLQMCLVLIRKVTLLLRQNFINDTAGTCVRNIRNDSQRLDCQKPTRNITHISANLYCEWKPFVKWPLVARVMMVIYNRKTAINQALCSQQTSRNVIAHAEAYYMVHHVAHCTVG